MTPQRYRRITQVLDRRQPDLAVLLEKVHKPHNLSAIMRTCDAVGASEAHAVTGDRPFRRNRTASMGSAKWVRGYPHKDIREAISALHERGFQVVAAHLSEQAVDFRSVDYTLPTAVLLGTEKYGVSDTAIALSDVEITVPMAGMVESLNVSVAAAVILYEAQRQRQAAGFYAHPRLSEDVYRDTLFRWGYPKLAKRYEERGIPFPRFSAEGEILDEIPAAVRQKIR